MTEWLTTNLEMFKQITTERLDIARKEVELKTRRESLDKLESGLKTLIEIVIETDGDGRAKAQYERICRVVAAGQDPSAKINKTHLMLDILKKSGVEGLNITTIQERLSALGVEVDRNYIHTVLGKLHKSRGLLTKEGNSYSLTEKGRTLTLKV